jgi:hypothetical protein
MAQFAAEEEAGSGLRGYEVGVVPGQPSTHLCAKPGLCFAQNIQNCESSIKHRQPVGSTPNWRAWKTKKTRPLIFVK